MQKLKKRDASSCKLSLKRNKWNIWASINLWWQAENMWPLHTVQRKANHDRENWAHLTLWSRKLSMLDKKKKDNPVSLFLHITLVICFLKRNTLGWKSCLSCPLAVAAAWCADTLCTTSLCTAPGHTQLWCGQKWTPEPMMVNATVLLSTRWSVELPINH